MPKYIEIGNSWQRSESGDSYDLGQSLARAALRDITLFEPSICFVFSSTQFSPFRETLAGIRSVVDCEIKSRFGQDAFDIPMIGCSTAAAVAGTQLLKDGLTLSIWASPYLRARTATAPEIFKRQQGRVILNDKSLRKALKALGLLRGARGHIKTSSSSRCLLIVSPGFSPEIKSIPNPVSRNEEIIENIASIIGRQSLATLPMWGGSSVGVQTTGGDDSKEAMQFLDWEAKTNSLALALIETELKIGVGMGFGYRHLNLYFSAKRNKGKTRHELQPYVINMIADLPSDQYFPSETENVTLEDEKYPARNILYSITDARTGKIYTAYPHVTPRESTHTKKADRSSFWVGPPLSDSFTLSPVYVDHERIKQGAVNALQRAMQAGDMEHRENVAAILSVSCRGRLRRMSMFHRLDGCPGPEAEFSRTNELAPSGALIGWYGNGEIGLTKDKILLPAFWSNSTLAISDELDSNSKNRIGESARAKASLCVRNLSRQLAKIGTSHGLLHLEEKHLWNTASEIIKNLLEGKCCTIFLRDDFDHFHVAGSTDPLCRPGANKDEKPWDIYYKRGEGLTGWVAKMGIRLNITRRTDAYLDKIYATQLKDEIANEWERNRWGKPPKLTPRWKNKFTENPDDAIKEHFQNAPFLATPIFVDRETVGVVRISGTESVSKRSFSLEDEYIIRACSRVISLAYTILNRAKEMRWEEIGFLEWSFPHQMGMPVENLEGHRHKLDGFLKSSEMRSVPESVRKELENWSYQFNELIDIALYSQARIWNVTQVDREGFKTLGLENFLKDFIRNLERSFRRVGESRESLKGIRISYRCEESVLIEANEIALGILVRELIQNAMKEMARSNLKGEIIVIAERGRDNHVILSFIDEGPGLFCSKDAQPRSERSGSGLAICEYIAKRHGADFFIETPLGDDGSGTAIHVVFHEPVRGKAKVGKAKVEKPK